MWAIFYLPPEVKYGSHLTNFYENVTVEQLLKNSYTKQNGNLISSNPGDCGTHYVF